MIKSQIWILKFRIQFETGLTKNLDYPFLFVIVISQKIKIILISKTNVFMSHEAHPNADHCLHSYSIQCCLKQLFSNYYAETTEYNNAICDLLGYLAKNHPSASGVVNWLAHTKKHPHFVKWHDESTLDEAKQALLLIISSPIAMEENISAEKIEAINRQRLAILEKLATKVPEFKDTLGLEIAA